MRYALLLVMGAVLGVWQMAPALAADEPQAAKTNPDAPDLTRCIQAIELAPDPSAAVAALANGFAVDRGNVKMLEAYITRMVEFGLPEMAYHQALLVTTQDPSGGLAWGVLAYVDAKLGQPVSAYSNIIMAADSVGDNPFIQRTAGQLMALYDTSKPKLDAALAAAMERTRAALGKQVAFASAYEATKAALARGGTIGTPASAAPTTQPAGPQSTQAVETGPQIPPQGPDYSQALPDLGTSLPVITNNYYYDYYTPPPPIVYDQSYYPPDWWWWPYGYFAGPVFFGGGFGGGGFRHDHFRGGRDFDDVGAAAARAAADPARTAAFSLAARTAGNPVTASAAVAPNPVLTGARRNPSILTGSQTASPLVSWRTNTAGTNGGVMGTIAGRGSTAAVTTPRVESRNWNTPAETFHSSPTFSGPSYHYSPAPSYSAPSYHYAPAPSYSAPSYHYAPAPSYSAPSYSAPASHGGGGFSGGGHFGGGFSGGGHR